MANDINIDVSQAIRDLEKQFEHLKGARGTSYSKLNQGIARALNRTIAMAQTQANKSVRSTYKVKAKDIRKTMVISKAKQNNLTSTIKVSARPLPIYAFGARQTKKGVSINITGKRKLIKSAFIATMKSGHTGVYGRGRYVGTEFQYRTKRVNKRGPDTPIEEFYTASPFSMVTNAAVSRAVADKINQNFTNRLAHELSRMSGATV